MKQTLDIDGRIEKAKVRITTGNPFFAYLTLYLTIHEDTKGLISPAGGMCVTQEDKIYYKKDFVDGIDDGELIFCILHEVYHRAFHHLERSNGKQMLRWNIAVDLVVNTLLRAGLRGSEYKVLKGCIIADDNDEFKIMGKKITEISKKSAEEVYYELPDMPEQEQKYKGYYKSFDEHKRGKENKKGEVEEMDSAEERKMENEWRNRLQTAVIHAKQRGNLPAGMERLVEKLAKVEIPWRVYLWRFVQQMVPKDYTYMKRAKASFATGVYLPSITKERIEVVIGVDTSGSIEQKHLDKFISEIISMARTYNNTIDMKIFFSDTEIQAEYDIHNGNIPKIRSMKIKGGGGTEFNDVIKVITKDRKYKNTKCLIFLTDGFGNKVTVKRNFPILWVLTKDGTDQYIKGNKRDTIIKLKSDE